MKARQDLQSARSAVTVTAALRAMGRLLRGFVLAGTVLSGVALAETPPPLPQGLFSSEATPDVAPDLMWTDLGDETAAVQLGPSNRPAMPNTYRLAQLDLRAMEDRLAQAPMEGTVRIRDGLEITLPMPDGTHQRFRVVESPFIGEQVQAVIPEYRSYLAQGVDDPTATLRMDTSRLGFKAYGRMQKGTLWIDSYGMLDSGFYISAWKHDFTNPLDAFDCGVVHEEMNFRSGGGSIPASGGTLHTFRLAMNLTGEYTEFFGTIETATAFSTVTINRVNLVYGIDLAIRFDYVYTMAWPDSDTDPFPTGDTVDSALLDLNQTWLDLLLGSANYDIGHILTQGNNDGLAGANVCTSEKARGGTGGVSPVGDPFDIDFVAHELGHQLDASHTFNGTTSNCGSNRSSSNAFEPGSGTTIMAYAGICGSENVQENCDAYFHNRSLVQMISYRDGVCGATSSTGNTPPTVDAGPDWTIPRETTFYVRASGSDVDGDALTYAWEQYDLGAASPPTDPFGPLFRSFSPTSDPARYFPDFTQAILGSSDLWEILPTVDRSLTLRVTVRDNVAGGGGVDDDEIELTVAGAPFEINSPNGGQAYVSGQPVPVSWSTGGSVGATVSFYFWNSSSGAFTFITSTANDGFEEIVMPCGFSASGRLWIEENTGSSLGVHIFDVTDSDISITAGLADYRPGFFGGVEDAVVFNSENSGALPTELFGDQNSFYFWGHRNDGNAWSCNNFEYELNLDERKLVDVSDPVGPGPGTTNIFGPEIAFVSGGRHTAWIVIDPDDLNPESDETNNGYARQWVWEPQPLGRNSSAQRSQPPERFAGQDHIPGGVDFFPNMDGMRIEFSSEVFLASAISSLNGSDYDVYLFDPSTGVENGFETPIGQSRVGGGATDFVFVNQLNRGGQAYDIGLERFSGDGDFIADYRDADGLAYPSGGGGPVTFDSDQILGVGAFFVAAGDVGPMLLQFENVSASQPLEVHLYSPDHVIGDRGDAFASTTISGDSGFVDFAATEGFWGFVVVRNASEGTDSFSYDVRFRPTPPDLATATLPGSHGPIVPRPDVSIPIGDPVPAPTFLPGDTFGTTFYYHLRNESSVGAPTWDFAVPIDGVESAGGGPFAGPFALPGGTTDIFSQAIGGGFFITGGRHTAGVVYDASDAYDEIDEGNNRHAEQWVWEPTQHSLGQSVTRSGPPVADGGWDDIPAGLPREFNCDGLRTPPFATSGADGYWGGFAITPTAGNVGLRAHNQSAGAQDGFAEFLEESDFGGNSIELVLFDLNTLGEGLSYDIGAYAAEVGQEYTAYNTNSTFVPDGNANTPFGESFPNTLNPGETFDIYEFGTFQSTTPVDLELTVENQSGDANLALMVFVRDDATGIYNIAEAAEIGEDNGDGGSETVQVTLGGEEYTAVVVLKVSGSDTGKTADYTLHFIDPVTSDVGDDVATQLETGMVNFPDPFAAQTDIHFAMETAGPASIRIYDVKGRLVRTLVDGQFPAGQHSQVWQGRDDAGREVANGIYLARFEHEVGKEMRRMVLIR